MTVVIKRVKNSTNFALCKWIGIKLVPFVVADTSEFLENFSKAQGYTWYFNLTEENAIAVD